MSTFLRKAGLPYLESPRIRKEGIGRRLVAKHPLDKPGLVCLLTEAGVGLAKPAL